MSNALVTASLELVTGAECWRRTDKEIVLLRYLILGGRVKALVGMLYTLSVWGYKSPV